MQRKAYLKFGTLIVLLAAALWLVRFSPYASHFTITALRGTVAQFGWLSGLAFVLIAALGMAALIPATIFTFIGAVLFGTVLGFALNVASCALGASLAFFVSKKLGGDFVEHLLGEKKQKIHNLLERHSFSGLLVLRMIPGQPFVVINYACGLCRMNFKDFFTATLLGMIPSLFVFTYLASTLGERVLNGKLTSAELLTPHVLVPVLLFLALIAATLAYKYRKALRTTSLRRK